MSRKGSLFLSVALAGAALLLTSTAWAGAVAHDVDVRVRETTSDPAMRIGTPVRVDALVVAADALEQYRDAIGRGPQDGFAFRLEEKDRIGQTHVRMEQTYRGFPVVGGELIVHVDRDGLLGVSGRFVSGLDLPAGAPLAPNEAVGAAVEKIHAGGGRNVEVVDVLDPVVYALSGEPTLAVPVRAVWSEDGELAFRDVYVDAATGAVVGSLSLTWPPPSIGSP